MKTLTTQLHGIDDQVNILNNEWLTAIKHNIYYLS